MRERGEVSIPQAARMLGVSERTLYRWLDEVESGDMRHCQFAVRVDYVGRRWLVREEVNAAKRAGPRARSA